jgi:hypothetical protein
MFLLYAPNFGWLIILNVANDDLHRPSDFHPAVLVGGRRSATDFQTLITGQEEKNALSVTVTFSVFTFIFRRIFSQRPATALLENNHQNSQCQTLQTNRQKTNNRARAQRAASCKK